MGKSKFPLPDSIEQIVALLNASRLWNLTLHPKAGRVDVVDGDQLMFTARHIEEVEAFLAGCFLATFMGKALDDIQEDIARGKYSNNLDWDDIREQLERERGASSDRGSTDQLP